MTAVVGRTADRSPTAPVRSPSTFAPGLRTGSAAGKALRQVREAARLALYRVAVGLGLTIGVALALSGAAVTGGSFGLLAFIGMPLLVIGLGVIGAAQSLLLAGPATPWPTATHHQSTNQTPGAPI